MADGGDLEHAERVIRGIIKKYVGVEELSRIISAAEARGVDRERERCAKIHDAEIARLNEQIAENDAYTGRTGSTDGRANKYCRDQLRWHERFGAAIRASAEKGVGHE